MAGNSSDGDRGRRAHGPGEQPGQDLLPRAGLHQARRGAATTSRSATASCGRCASVRPHWSAGPAGSSPGAKLSTRADHTGDAFYQKRLPTSGVPEWIETAEITFPSGRTADELCPVDLAHVAWAAQLGTIVFHPWPVRRSDVDSPDELRIDLDPQPGTDFADAATVAGVVRALLDELGWVGFPKTSGGRGVTSTSGSLHSGRSPRCAGPRSRSRRELERRRPTWPPRSGGRRSAASGSSSTTTRWPATARSPAPTRCAPTPAPPRPRPVTWDELPQVEPNDFTLDTVQERIAKIGDPHATINDVAPRHHAAAGVVGAGRARRARATCRTRPTTRRCPASPSASSRARTVTAPAHDLVALVPLSGVTRAAPAARFVRTEREPLSGARHPPERRSFARRRRALADASRLLLGGSAALAGVLQPYGCVRSANMSRFVLVVPVGRGVGDRLRRWERDAHCRAATRDADLPGRASTARPAGSTCARIRLPLAACRLRGPQA